MQIECMATGMGDTSFPWVLGREYLKPWEGGLVHGLRLSESPPEPSSGMKTSCCSSPKLPLVPYIELSAVYGVHLQMALTMICHFS